MDAAQPRDNYETMWKEVVEECRKILDDDADYELIVGFENYPHMVDYLKALQERYTKGATARLLHPASSHFQRFHMFAAFILFELGGQNLSAAFFLGACVLLVDVNPDPNRYKQSLPLMFHCFKHVCFGNSISLFADHNLQTSYTYCAGSIVDL